MRTNLYSLIFLIFTYPTIAVSVNCHEVFEPVTAEDSPNKEYFESLLKIGLNAPIQDFLKLWYPNEASYDGAYFFDCQSAPWGPVGRYYDLSQICSPDVVYSWGSHMKLEGIKKAMPDGKTWSGSPNAGRPSIFSALTPVSTFAYGLIPVRFKVKHDVLFTTDSFNPPYSIRVRNVSYQEFIINDASTLDSWSYGTPELYDEVVKDINRVISGKRAQGYYFDEPRGIGFNRLLGTLYDGTDPSENTFKTNLLELIRMILAGEGRIYYAIEACRNRVDSYSTIKPTYFNPI